MTKLIEKKKTTIPTKEQQVFSTADENQTSVYHPCALQGEREMASGNKSLGHFNLAMVSPRPTRYAADRGHLRH